MLCFDVVSIRRQHRIFDGMRCLVLSVDRLLGLYGVKTFDLQRY